ncbi:hypothetical protein [Pseudonocardia endophytica]|nr:hypothetical protein [Pseudonocardia endophytica]
MTGADVGVLGTDVRVVGPPEPADHVRTLGEHYPRAIEKAGRV